MDNVELYTYANGIITALEMAHATGHVNTQALIDIGGEAIIQCGGAEPDAPWSRNLADRYQAVVEAL